MNHIDRLPKELLLLILDHIAMPSDHNQCNPRHRDMLIHLRRCTLVNKRFYDAVIPTIWSNPTRFKQAMNFKTPTLPLLLNILQSSSRSTSLGQHIRQLQFDDGYSVEVMVPLISYTPLLKILDISCHHRVPRNIDAPLRQMPPHCPDLVALTLTGMEFGDQALAVISQCCRSIRTLTFRQCTGFSDEALNALLTGYQSSLQSFSLSVSRAWPDRLGNHLHLDHLQQISSLSLTGCDGIGNRFLRCSRFPFLTECQLRDSGVDIHADPSALLSFLQAHPLLKSLTLWHCKVDDRTLVSLVPSIIPNLYRLSLTDNGYPLSANVVRQLVKNCVCLSWLHLNDCSIPSSCFPEVSHWSFKIELLKPDDIIKIRRSDSNRIFTVENDEVPNREIDYRISA
ncbi:hypothetical protein [Absidia glauca]|uniref:Uncharacterized protein n=1 Tax=Absidia glauca TaxID=4829 RepID=A0A163JRX8_ABSGL|nr:hypothetical protein [Absidia glauca]